MTTILKAIGLTISVSALLLSSTQHSQGTISTKSLEAAPIVAAQLPYQEINAYYDGGKWVSGGIQCDGSNEVTIVKQVGTLNSFRVVSFPKSQPTRKTNLTLRLKGDPDCGMMKCYSTYVAPRSHHRYVIMESNYRDEEAFWTHAIMLGKGKAAESNMDECRWHERTRVALITEMRSIYVTQDETGELEYKSFNHKGAGAEPSVTVKSGKSKLDSARGRETFTFTNGEYTYEVNVSTSDKRPFAEVLVRKNGGTIQKERTLVYTYARKI